jgi:hypothetical protein
VNQLDDQPIYFVHDDYPESTLWRVFAPGEERWNADTGWQPSNQVMHGFFGRDYGDPLIGFGSAVYSQISAEQARERFAAAFREGWVKDPGRPDQD